MQEHHPGMGSMHGSVRSTVARLGLTTLHKVT